MTFIRGACGTVSRISTPMEENAASKDSATARIVSVWERRNLRH
jgi:hypothetical protein